MDPLQVAKKYLLSELNMHGGLNEESLKKVCSDGRWGGGTSYAQYNISIGNMINTSPKNPAKNMKVEWYDPENDQRKSKVFKVEDVYKLLVEVSE